MKPNKESELLNLNNLTRRCSLVTMKKPQQLLRFFSVCRDDYRGSDFLEDLKEILVSKISPIRKNE